MMNTEEHTTDFGTILCELRSKKGYTITDLCTTLDIHRDTLRNWESNHSVPDILSLKKLSDLFQVPIDNFLNILYPPEVSEELPIETIADETATPAPVALSKTGLFKTTFAQDEAGLLRKMTAEQKKRYIYYLLITLVLAISIASSVVNLVVCAGVLVFIIWKGLHNGWIYACMLLCSFYDLQRLNGWFL